MKTTEPNASNSPSRAFNLLLCVAALFIMAGATGCEKKPTGYETTTHFVADGWTSEEEELNEMMAEGWEVLNSRRAWSSRYGRDEKWGTEYTLGRPTYD
jgi:hypothetical protein